MKWAGMYLECICRVMLIVVLAAAVAGKARAFGAFAASLRELGLGRAAPAAAVATVAAESAAVVLLAVPRSARLGYGLAVVLLVTFIAGIFAAVRSERPVTCNCFGTGSEQLSAVHVVRNGLLLGVAVTGLVSATVWPARFPGLAEGALTGTFGALFAIVLIRWEDLHAILSTARH
ncbi:MauE/DoxX family redox-associated membrane protein [Actinoplanes sp. NPDC051861]|uniref:MauE/DoxX family redox-associated membrane protein n=1 Tax=Actinoplanes sp. NPDC051861 TaxID=3155170 RepID=UPI00342C839D